MRLVPLQALLVVLGASAARAEGPPWWIESRAAGGLDSNVLRDPSAREQSPLLRVDGEAGLHWLRDVHLVAGGYLEQNLEISALSEAELEAQLGARQPLGSRLTLVIGSLTAYRRELSVFSDGLLLTTGAILRNEVAEDAVALLELDLGPVDLEAGARGDLKSTSGNEDYLLLGAGVLASARWLPLPTLALRARYAFTYRSIDGLTIRNAMGGATGLDRAIHLALHAARLGLRWTPLDALAVTGRWEHTFLFDDITGYLDGSQDDVRSGLLLAWGRRASLEVGFQFLLRQYSARVASATNQVGEATLGLVLDAQVWILDHLGAFAEYRLERVEADPLGLLYTRHIVLVGATGRVGWLDPP